jgi:uncharacterized membrane protein YesL
MQQRVMPRVLAPPGPPPAATPSTWAIRLYEAADEVVWAAKLTLLWSLFTLAGGVVAGLGPATVAAYAVARRRALGESFHAWPAFTAVYRREFGRGTLLVLPLAGAGLLLATNSLYFASLGSAGSVPRLATLGALAALIVVTAHLLPMAAHYDLRLPAYLPKASLFALTRPAASILLLFGFTAIVFAVATYPVLVIVAVGGWIQLDTWLCLRFFAENEARLRAKGIS